VGLVAESEEDLTAFERSLDHSVALLDVPQPVR